MDMIERDWAKINIIFFWNENKNIIGLRIKNEWQMTKHKEYLSFGIYKYILDFFHIAERFIT